MKFGFTGVAVGPEGMSDADCYAKALEDCRLGEELGFDSVWLLEHHFTPYFPTPDIMLLLATVAAKYPKLDLGACVIVLPWHHPLRLAEQIAMVRLLSRGNLYLGLGRGTALYEYLRFELDMNETRQRFQEALEIIRLALKGEPFSYDGEFFHFPETQVRPNVGRMDGIHFFGAIGSPETAPLMAEFGLPILQATHAPDEINMANLKHWKTRAEELGMPTEKQLNPVLVRPVILADSDEEARDLARRTYPGFARAQLNHYETDQDHWQRFPSYRAASKMFKMLGQLAEGGETLERFLDRQLVGTPETVIRRLKEIQERLECGNVICDFAQYGMENEAVHRSMRMFAETVIPQFRNNGGG